MNDSDKVQTESYVETWQRLYDEFNEAYHKLEECHREQGRVVSDLFHKISEWEGD